MIGIGTVVAVIAGKVDVVNAGNEFTKSQGTLLGIGFHGLMLYTGKPHLRHGVYTPLEKLVHGVFLRL